MLRQLIVTAAVLGLAVPAAQAERTPLSRTLSSKGFQKIARKRGVTVYKHPRSSIIRVGAEGKFPYPVEKVFKALIDYKRQKPYIPRLSESRVLKKGKNWLTVYQRLNLPVISDRDFTLFVKWGKVKNVTWIEYRAVTNRGPGKRKGIVRVSLHRGSWQLQPTDGGKATFARFQVVIDLSGWLPKWMARSGSGKEVPKVFAGIRRLLAKVSY
jgi:hypothetical protein